MIHKDKTLKKGKFGAKKKGLGSKVKAAAAKKDGAGISKPKFQHKRKKEDKKPAIKSEGQHTGTPNKKHLKRKFPQKPTDGGEKKPKLINMKRKDRRLIRKKKDHAPTFERSKKLKVLWEDLRREECKPERRIQLVNECFKLIKGHAKELSYAHDTVRVLEWVFGLGTDQHKTALFDELKDNFINLAKSKYGKFFLIKVFHHGSKSQKNHLMKEFHGKVNELLCHTEAAAVVEVAYNECANATQRAELVQEFYGPSYRYFKESKCHSLHKVLEKSPDEKPAIIQHMKEAIIKLLQKTVIQHSIVHFILYELLRHADLSSVKEVIEAARDVIVEMLHTKEGARAAMHCLWQGTTKDRKAIIKSFKTHVAKIAKEEYGHMVLLSLFDCVDDTKLVAKHIISEIINNLSDINENLHGRKVLVYLLTPRDRVHFHPDVIRILEEGDTNETSKKDPEIRRAELKKSIVAPLIQFIVDNASKMYTDNSCCIEMLTIMKHSEGARIEAYRAIAQLASQQYSSEMKNSHIIESSGSHYMLKKLIEDDRTPNKEVYFSDILVQEVSTEALKSWTSCNRGCFLLVSLLETKLPSVVEKVKEAMHGLHKQLCKKTFRGAEILIEKLKK